MQRAVPIWYGSFLRRTSRAPAADSAVRPCKKPDERLQTRLFPLFFFPADAIIYQRSVRTPRVSGILLRLPTVLLHSCRMTEQYHARIVSFCHIPSALSTMKPLYESILHKARL